MASELRVNTLKDASGNNSVGMSYVAEGSAKAWYNRKQTDTVATRDSLNSSSLTDNGTGDFTQSWSSNFNNDDYAAGSMADNTGTYVTRGPGGTFLKGESDQTTSSFRAVSCYGSDAVGNGEAVNKVTDMAIFMGDLA